VVQELLHRLYNLERRHENINQTTNLRLLKSTVSEHIKQRIPGPVMDRIITVTSETDKRKINSMTKEDALKVLLYQMLYNTNDKEIQYHTNMCYSRIGTLAKKFEKGIKAYTKKHMSPKRKETRVSISREIIPDHYPERLRSLTALLDGTDVHVFKPRNANISILDHSPWISCKFAKPGLRTQIISDLDGYFEWKSDSTPAGKHGFIHLLANELAVQSIYDGEAIGTDKGYTGETVLNIVHPVKNARGSDKIFNNQSKKIGSKLERSFGFLKHRFKMFEEYRGNVEFFNLLLGFAMAITNEIRKLNEANLIYRIADTEWNDIINTIQR
jgi:hypothetical protein